MYIELINEATTFENSNDGYHTKRVISRPPEVLLGLPVLDNLNFGHLDAL